MISSGRAATGPVQPQGQGQAISQQTSPTCVLNIWVRSEVETLFPYLIDGKTKTENGIPRRGHSAN